MYWIYLVLGTFLKTFVSKVGLVQQFLLVHSIYVVVNVTQKKIQIWENCTHVSL